jgi:hypothetical protein
MHQIRYDPRMGDIEFIADELSGVETTSGRASPPLIDCAWYTAGARVRKLDKR